MTRAIVGVELLCSEKIIDFKDTGQPTIAQVGQLCTSIVRTSVFSWWTFPAKRDLWLTCDHFVGKVSAVGQPNRPFIPPGSASKYYSM